MQDFTAWWGKECCNSLIQVSGGIELKMPYLAKEVEKIDDGIWENNVGSEDLCVG